MPDIKYFSNIQSKSTGDVYVVKDKEARDQIATKADNTTTFTEASTRANITSGETIPTILGKIKKYFTDLKAVAFSGSYNDLSNKPTIPAAANNGTLTIQKNGTNVQTFTANQSTNATANITVPTKTSELTNDSGYITGSYLPLSGGNMTGNIAYTGSKATYNMIKFINNTDNAYGNGIAIGGGGQVIIGGGESSDVMIGQTGTTGEEIMWIGNDGDVNIYTNLQNGWEPRKSFVFNTSGNLIVPGSITENGTALSSKYAAKSDIPTVNNGTLTIQKNGTNVQTFTANQSTNATANITVPTKTSELTNDSGYKTTDTNTTYTLGTSGNSIVLTPSSGTANTITVPYATSAGSATSATSASSATTATTADKLAGFSSRSTTMTWGNQTGTVLTCFSDSAGGGLGFRANNPISGQTSMIIDGTVYIKEGATNVGDAVKSFSVSGTTVTYTTLLGNTGTFTTQDTNTTYDAMSSSELTTGTATVQRTVRADYLKSGINSLIDTKIGGLDVASVGGTGKYISTISETNGKITATATDLVAVVNPSTTPTAEGSIWIVTT